MFKGGVIMPVDGVESVAKKKAGQPSKKPETLIRASEECAAAIGEAARFENVSTSQWLDAHVLPLARRLYRDGVIEKAKRLKGSD
jgi:hypothetical protein